MQLIPHDLLLGIDDLKAILIMMYLRIFIIHKKAFISVKVSACFIMFNCSSARKFKNNLSKHLNLLNMSKLQLGVLLQSIRDNSMLHNTCFTFFNDITKSMRLQTYALRS